MALQFRLGLLPSGGLGRVLIIVIILLLVGAILPGLPSRRAATAPRRRYSSEIR